MLSRFILYGWDKLIEWWTVILLRSDSFWLINVVSQTQLTAQCPSGHSGIVHDRLSWLAISCALHLFSIRHLRRSWYSSWPQVQNLCPEHKSFPSSFSSCPSCDGSLSSYPPAPCHQYTWLSLYASYASNWSGKLIWACDGTLGLPLWKSPAYSSSCSWCAIGAPGGRSRHATRRPWTAAIAYNASDRSSDLTPSP